MSSPAWMSQVPLLPRVPLPTMTTRRWRYALVVGAVITGIVLILDAATVFSEQPLTKQYYTSAKELLTPCPEWCEVDPFRQPGMLHWSPSGADNETRWLPFPTADYEWDAQPPSSDLPHTDEIPAQAWLAAPEQYTALLERFKPTTEGEWQDWTPPRDLNWLRNRTVILIGSSHDRNNNDQMCEIIGGKKGSWGGHSGGYCYHEGLDLLVANWFLYGMIDSDDGWPHGEEHPFPFEDRFEKIMIPQMTKLGYEKRVPDLVIASSLFWDEKFLDERGRDKTVDRKSAHGFWWNELAWFRGRVRKLVETVREMWPHTPVMFRTRQLRSSVDNFHLLTIFQLDQGLRALGKELGVRLFTWGDKLEGYNVYYDNDQHFAKGPNTYLFGDMLLFYLHRAVTPGCWQCQKE